MLLVLVLQIKVMQVGLELIMETIVAAAVVELELLVQLPEVVVLEAQELLLQ
jgi:hypothetical protein